MIIVYVAGSYSAADVFQVSINITKANALGMEIVKRFGHLGVTVIIPHNNMPHWEGLQSPLWFYIATAELLKRSDVCIHVPGDEETSTGTRDELKLCMTDGKPFFSGDEEGFKEFEKWLTTS